MQLIEFKIAAEERQKAAVEAAQGQTVSPGVDKDHLAKIGRRFARARERYRREQRAKADMEGEADAPKGLYDALALGNRLQDILIAEFELFAPVE